MKRTHQEVDEILKDSKEYIRDYFMGKKDVEIPENFLKKSFESTAENINKYVPDFVNTKWIPEVNGNCLEKNCKEKATKDYNQHGHYVCDYHYEKLNDEFDEDYR